MSLFVGRCTTKGRRSWQNTMSGRKETGVESTQERASRYLWNPMARMADVLGEQRVWCRGEGSTLINDAGREFVDGCGSLWYVLVGYGRDEIVDAAAAQMRQLPAWMIFGNNVTPAT